MRNFLVCPSSAAFCRQVVLIALGALVCLWDPGAAHALPSDFPVNSSPLPLVLQGRQVPSLIGADPAGIAAFACPEGRPRSVLVQVDEFDAQGRVVGPGLNNTRTQDETPRAVDENDQIVVMLKDLAGPCEEQQFAKAKGVLVKVEVGASFLKAPAYFYLLAGEVRVISTGQQYVRYDPAGDRTQTEAYTFGYDDERRHIFDEVAFPNLQGAPNKDVSDRLKVRLHSKGLGSLVTININEDEIRSKLEVVRAGPVRVIRSMSLEVSPVPGVTIKAGVDFTHYERLWDAQVHFQLPVTAATALSSLDVSFSQDYIGLEGVTVSTAAMPKGAVVDGRMLESEKSMAFGDKPWSMVTGRGITMLITIEFEKSLKLEGTTVFIDDPAYRDPPEEEPGTEPTIGFTLNDWQDLAANRPYHFGAKMAFLPNFPERGGNGYYDVMYAPLSIKAEAVQTSGE